MSYIKFNKTFQVTHYILIQVIKQVALLITTILYSFVFFCNFFLNHCEEKNHTSLSIMKKSKTAEKTSISKTVFDLYADAIQFYVCLPAFEHVRSVFAEYFFKNFAIKTVIFSLNFEFRLM